VRELWVGAGRMTDVQLAAVLDQIGPATTRDTMLFAGDVPKQQVAAETKLSRGHASKIPHVATAPTDASLVTASPAVPVVRQESRTGEPTPPTIALAASAIPPRFVDDATQPLTAIREVTPVIANRYQQLFQLGAGGLGEVFACEDKVLGRTVAVKVGHKTSDVDAYSSRLILSREAQIISCLEHPNIIPVYDAGHDPGRGAFYVMRQVTDTTLETILRRRREGDGDAREYAIGRLLRYFLQICNAVDYAHHRGMIHCDIKPPNILLGEYGEVLLVDWGLAQSRNHPLGVRGGTLGYMAPEQMDATLERVDERADVFALGAILYEILSGQSAFADAKHSGVTTLGSDPFKIYRMPAPPTPWSPEIEITPEIEDICMRAIEVHREKRLAKVRPLADAIEELIEGSKQRERRRIEADKSADAAEELAERYHEFAESRPEKLTVFRALRADLAPWAPVDEKQDQWDAEDIVRITDALQVRTFHSAVSAFERALDSVPKHARARRGLARLYWSELQRARRRGEALDQIAYEQLLREVDDGTYVRELQREGSIELHVGPHAATIVLATLAEKQRRLVAGSSEVLAERPTARRSLAAGRYVVTATIAGGKQRVSWPISIEPGSARTLAIDPPPAAALRADEVLIPGGVARLGGDALATEGDDLIEVDLPTFVLQRYPVTFALWFEFLDALRATDESLVAQHIPRTMLGMPSWEFAGNAWQPDRSMPSLALPPAPELLPVFGVSAESAEAYARWRSQTDGLSWRLPTELEWEKAGRGTDGRIYPWGDHFDATFCKMRDSRQGMPLAEHIGSFDGDVSPYGVCDLAGGIADWCTPDPRRTSPREPREVVSRGGAWCDWPIDCRLASRRRYLAIEHSARVGVRLARDL
jgi:serine/threonine-protein kinase